MRNSWDEAKRKTTLAERGDGRRIISMRYGHADEEAHYREQMD